MADDALSALRVSVAERCAELRGGVAAAELPEALLDVVVQRFDVSSSSLVLVSPREWEQLRHEEGAAGRGVPYWARPWPSGLALAASL
ncbi:MAG: methyltransferase protein, partial [Conexibacter sp.]|nr:methyltransferase protein [Conexibacter sp.]